MSWRAFVPWLIAIGGTGAVTWLGHEMELGPSTAGFAFLIVVLFATVRGSLLVGAVASIVATLCYNFFFFPPFYTFTIVEPVNWFALAAFLITSVIVSRLVVEAREEADRAARRRNEIESLYGLSVDLFTATLGEAAGRALRHLGAREGGLVLFDGTPFRQKVVFWIGAEPEKVQDRIAAVGRHKEPLELSSPLGRDVYLPLLAGEQAAGALVARGTEASLPALVSASRLVGLAVEREKFIEDNAHVQALRESETLKTSILRAISHDLATPLTAITIQTEALRRKCVDDEELKATVAGIAEETARLRRRIDNLMSMARLEAGKAKPRREPTPPADLFRGIRENLPGVFESRAVRARVDDDCPDANVDPSLALEILVNLIENAHRVSPAGAAIELHARSHPKDPSTVSIEVLDRGPGFPAGVADADGNLLSAATTDVAQRGLGLEIARSLAVANGGRIGLFPREGGGAVARLDVPAASLPAVEPS